MNIRSASNSVRSSPLIEPLSSFGNIVPLRDTASTEKDDDKQNYDQIINNFVAINERLKVLARLKGGYKIWVNCDDSFTMDDSYVPSISRMISGQSRKRIIERITKDVDYITKYYSALEDKARTVVQVNAKASLFGIYNLKNMYSDYSSELDVCANKISRAVQ